MTWSGLVWKNLFRRRSRTALTAAGVSVGVALIVALLAITNGVHRTAADLIHVGRADFGLYQADVSDFTRSFLPESLARRVAHEPGVAAVANVKLLVAGGLLVFGLDPHQFAYRRLVVVAGRRGTALAGDRSGAHVGERVAIAGRRFRISGLYHSGDRYEDLGFVLPLHVVQALARRPGDVTSIGVVAQPGADIKAVARRLQRSVPGLAAITEPGQAVQVDTSSRLILSTGWIVSILALIVGGIGVANTMAMSVLERVREIGVLRAVGWRTWRIAALVVSEAVGICLLGLAAGFAFGVVGAQLFVSRSTLSGLIAPSYTAGTFAWGLAFALGVGLTGAFSPALRAVRLRPIQALRHE